METELRAPTIPVHSPTCHQAQGAQEVIPSQVQSVSGRGKYSCSIWRAVLGGLVVPQCYKIVLELLFNISR